MSNPPTPLFTRMSQVALASEDPTKLVSFYRDVLGFRYAFETAGMHFFEIAGTMLMIGPKYPQMSIGGDATLYFEPAAWSATETALTKANVAWLNDAAIVLQRAEGRELCLRAFKDPEGHTLAMFGWRDAS
ncbi:MAG: VOC family protein [Proteobacteria bacterium]|nr:VOC family protein [Pseudomonadota bacterium]